MMHAWLLEIWYIIIKNRLIVIHRKKDDWSKRKPWNWKIPKALHGKENSDFPHTNYTPTIITFIYLIWKKEEDKFLKWMKDCLRLLLLSLSLAMIKLWEESFSWKAWDMIWSIRTNIQLDGCLVYAGRASWHREGISITKDWMDRWIFSSSISQWAHSSLV